MYDFLNPDTKYDNIDKNTLRMAPVGFSTDFAEYNYLGIQQPKFAITFDQMRKIAEKNAWVDSAVRRVTDTMGSLDWQIVPDKRYINLFLKDKIMQRAKIYLEELFRMQNGTFNDLSQTIKAVTRDLMIMDAGAIEIVRKDDPQELKELGIKHSDRKGRIIGLIARDAGSIFIDHDEHQVHRRYVQVGLNARQIYPYDDNNPIFTMDISGAFAVFDRHDMIYMRIQPRAGSAYGTPPILTLLQSLQADEAADRDIERLMGSGGVLPGFINIDENLDPNIVKRYTEAFKRIQVSGRRELPIISGGGNATFVPIAANNREMEKRQLQEYYMKKILAVFGVPPHMLGVTDGVNRGVAFAQTDSYMANAINPLKIYFENMLTNSVVKEFHPWLRFEFLEPRAIDFETRYERGSRMKQDGLITDAQFSIMIGEEPATEKGPAALIVDLDLQQRKINLEISKKDLASREQTMQLELQQAQEQKEQMEQQAQQEQAQEQGPEAGTHHFTDAIQGASQEQQQLSPEEMRQVQKEEQVKKSMFSKFVYLHPERFQKNMAPYHTPTVSSTVGKVDPRNNDGKKRRKYFEKRNQKKSIRERQVRYTHEKDTEVLNGE